ncbi:MULTISPECIES: DUF1015 domain-containing protein [Pseudothermotoga]|jgi:uncharacterized protein (DUF1015 family)|uniref:Uncharacterized conserved protein UCP033563 n=1 Tax=Pseudothermotoga lettingae (strain ATCC BAA-301 / DSM 14385 / NBRC 107922 / TMO) TaxID=416591 RepID=A8F8N9_PSELT
MVVKPFRAVRPKKEFASSVAAKPYDVVDSREAKEVLKLNPYTFYRVTKPEINFDKDMEPSSSEVLQKAREILSEMISSGILIQDETECFYIYKQTGKDHIQIGLVATFHVDDYLNNKIKKHELTRKEKEDERAKHIYHLKAQTGPVFLMYRSSEKLDSLIERFAQGEPEYDFTDEDGIRQTVYVVKDRQSVELIKKAFEGVDSFYIADGHHRAASAVRVAQILRQETSPFKPDEEYNYFLGVLFPHKHLKIYDYNRVIRDLNGLTVQHFISSLENIFDLSLAPHSPYKPVKKHEFGMYIGGKWYILRLKEGLINESDPVRSLDVSILQEFVLKPILGIDDPRTDKRIEFVGGIYGLRMLENYVDKKGFSVAFALYPTSVEDLMKISDFGFIMPPKSTWFEPKLKSGLFIHLI